ncbi:MAG: DUF485 domain-containing protein [Terriglobales bacterium]
MNDQREKSPSNASSQPSVHSQWDHIASSEQFSNLLQIKKLFIIPAFVFFFAYYFALAVLVGYAPKLASTRVIGTVTVAYLFALSQFAAGWIIAGLYLLASARFDALTKDILAQVALQEVALQNDEPQGDN